MYCRICGNELNDKAIICPKCGCAVEKVKESKSSIFNDDKGMVIKLLKYITIGLICFSLMCLILSLMNIWVSSSSGNLYIGTDSLICSLIFAIGTLGAGVTLFCLGFQPKYKEERTSIINYFIVSCFLFITVCISCGIHL